MKFLTQNWETVYNQCFRLFEAVRADNYFPDVVVGIARGGWIPARLIADFFSVKFTANLKIEAYQMIGESEIEPIITQDVNAIVKGKKVLIVDDIADSGESLKVALERLHQKEIKSVKIATLYYKDKSSVIPDYFLEKTDAWVIFAWEYYETIQELSDKWKSENISEEDIKLKLKEISIPPAIVDSCFKFHGL